ncbi:hypothetical protein APSETT445_009090 [Aspergillus pseudonomiae]
MGWSSSNAAVSAALKGAMRRVLFIVSGSESAKDAFWSNEIIIPPEFNGYIRIHQLMTLAFIGERLPIEVYIYFAG